MKQLLALSFILASGCVELDDPDATLATTEQEVALPGYTIVTTSVASTTQDAIASATCPAGTVVLGGSFAGVDGSGAYLTRTIQMAGFPAVDQHSWLVTGRYTGGGAWTLRVRAVCGVAPAGYQIVVTGTGLDTVPSKQVAISCPAGKKSIGGGFAITDASYGTIPGEATYLMPAWDGSGWLINGRTLSKGSWRLYGYSICADAAALAGYEVVTDQSAYDTLTTKQVYGGCPNGKVMTGAGWGVVDGTNAILEGRATQHEIGYAGTDWLTNARNLSTFTSTWRLQQRRLCVN